MNLQHGQACKVSPLSVTVHMVGIGLSFYFFPLWLEYHC